MDAVQFHIEWKNYLRNRLLGLIKRVGPKVLNKSLRLAGKKAASITAMISGTDLTIRRYCHAIEKYGLERAEGDQVFAGAEAIPGDASPDHFLEELHRNHLAVIAFLEALSSDDLERELTTRLFDSHVTVGWILQYTSLLEQDLTSRILMLLEQNKITVHPPWATNRYMRPVRQIRLN